MRYALHSMYKTDKKRIVLIFLLTSFVMIAYSQVNKKYPQNTLSKAEKKKGWKLLFDGVTLDKWRGARSEIPPGNWHVEDGTIKMEGTHAGGAEDLISTVVYENFELSLEWKIAEGGNSGIHFHVSIDPKYKYSSETGPEMQVLDNDRHPDGKGKDGLHRAGALYDLYPATAEVVKPVGSFNHVRLLVNKGHVEHWLNGVKIVEYNISGEAWEEKIRHSKFAKMPAFGRLGKGHIALQDHGDKVWYRNVKIRVL